MGEINKSQGLETILIADYGFKDPLVDVIVSEIDIAHSLHKLSHALKPCQIKPVVAKLESLDLVDAPGPMNVLDHLVAGQTAVR